MSLSKSDKRVQERISQLDVWQRCLVKQKKIWLLGLWSPMDTIGIKGGCDVNVENVTQLCAGQMDMAPCEKSITKPEHTNIMKPLIFILIESDTVPLSLISKNMI